MYDISAEGAALRVAGSMDTAVKQLDLKTDGQQVLTSGTAAATGTGSRRLLDPDLTEQVGRYPIEP